ncbi:oligoribonuclease [Demequina mangrovi]|uniref:Oligoribonuclease n=1 Tax=Demequina mangrovi TaxID=1043493 RepID=A0A1H7AV74_9MICO|nr:oligoribonuclease [Demequina mangrovi]SEJ68534.1 oligoribonuclease [Demequina mangrovi]
MTDTPLVWIDCEMTGLDVGSDALVEVACLVTDSDLNVLGDGVSVVIKPSAEALAGMGDFVRTMHETSGLLPELEHGTTMEDAQAQVLAYIQAHVPVAGKAHLAGNTVGMDRMFLERDMPEVIGHLHYRVVDVSSLKELVRRWYPRVFFQAPAKTGGHRALGDIRDSITELRYYRETILVPLPGPDSDEAKAAAARVAPDASRAAP